MKHSCRYLYYNYTIITIITITVSRQHSLDRLIVQDRAGLAHSGTLGLENFWGPILLFVNDISQDEYTVVAPRFRVQGRPWHASPGLKVSEEKCQSF